MSESEIEDRRQRALEAGLDAATGMWDGDDFRNGTEEAVKVATQVKITDEAVKAAIRPVLAFVTDAEIRAILRSTLPELGFEVVE